MILNTENNIYKNPKNFWKIIKSNKNNIPPFMKFNNIETNNSEEISNLFALHFGSIYQKTNLRKYPIN